MPSDEHIQTLFFRPKPLLAILALRDEKREWYASSLAKEIDCTFPHIIKILSRLEASGIVRLKESGRKKLILPTEKGKAVAASIARVLESLAEPKK